MWVDHGSDFYAAQTWSDVPAADDRRIMLAWMNNWNYARQVPTSPWRGAQSLPRELSLQSFEEGIRLVQEQIREISSLRGEHLTLRDKALDEANGMIQKFPAELLEVQVELEVGESSEVGVSVREGGKERTRIGYMTALREVWVDRTESGKTEFHENFAGKHSARLDLKDGRLFLHVLVDSSSVEVLAEKGRVAITGRIFPSSDSRGWSLFGGKGARVVRLDAWKLKSGWVD